VITPSQTIGPFFERALIRKGEHVLGKGGRRLEGRILDGDGQPVAEAMIELWDGEHFGRVGTDDEGRFAFDVDDAPHIGVTIFARGLLNHVSTRVYFSPEHVPEAVPANRRSTLVARRNGDTFTWDVVLQGPPERETVFFAFRR
jgi:protocatechuate 3,4-dioxygenase alpha subunit